MRFRGFKSKELICSTYHSSDWSISAGLGVLGHLLQHITILMVCFTILNGSVVSRKLSHPKLVQLYGVCSQQKPIYIVTEFMEHGCLLNFLRQRRGSFSFGSLLSISLDVSEGMQHLEANGFIHRDLVTDT